jgi:hypothetical protein
MADDPQHDDVLVAPVAPRKRRRRWPWIVVGVLVVLPALLYAAWAAITLNYTYADDGQRAGYLQKLSRKGWICKTWEGELAMVNIPGAAQERFAFTVRSDSIAQILSKMVGARVSITYEQHKGVPGSCFGDTEYYVKHVQAAAQ